MKVSCLYVLVSFLFGILVSFVYLDKTSILFSIKKDSRICSSNLLNVTIKKIFVAQKDSCGFWKENFIENHQSILNDKSSFNYLISYSYKGNFSLNLNKVIHDFYLSLLTKRAFQLLIEGTINQFESIYLYSNINWTTSANNRPLAKNLSSSPTTDLSKYSNRKLLVIKSNQSQMENLFSNEIYAKQFEELGLNLEDSFRCAFQFLFSLKEHFRVRNSLLKFNASLIISIDIQLANLNQTISVDNYQVYIQCAKQIQSFQINQNKQTFWYLTSNSLKLKKIFKQKFPKEILTDAQSDHFDKFHEEYPFETLSVEFDEIRTSEYHILSPLSHLARLAALTTDHFNHVYLIENQQTLCSLQNHKSFRHLIQF